MATRQYIGARYVPKFYENSDGTAEWRAGVIYEPLTIVTYNGNSYTSKKNVPSTVGNPSINPSYWVATGNFNEQLSDLSTRVGNAETEIDELNDKVDELIGYEGQEPINVLSLGVDNTGVEDCSTILNSASEHHLLFFPEGTYRLTSPFYIKNSIYGSGATRAGYVESNIKGTVFKIDFESETETAGLIVTANMRGENCGMEVEHVSIDCNNKANISGFKYDPVLQLYGRITMKIEDVHVGNVGTAAHGFYLTASGFLSRAIWLNNFSVYCAAENTESALYVGENLADCSFTNFEIMYGHYAVECHGGTCRFNNAHVYGGRASNYISDMATYFNTTLGFNLFASCMLDNIYVDSFKQAVVQRGGSSIIGNLQVWYDTFANTLTSNDGIAVRAIKNSRVAISNMLVGGAKTARKLYALIIGAHVTVDKLTLSEWDDIDENKPGLLPWITENSLRKSYAFKASEFAQNGYYMNFAIAYMGSTTGHLEFTAGRGALNSRITVKRSAGTITLANVADIEGSGMSVYYRQSGNFIYFYANQFGDNFNVEVKSISGAGEDVRNQNVLLDVTSIPDYNIVSQVTTDGLTLIE